MTAPVGSIGISVNIDASDLSAQLQKSISGSMKDVSTSVSKSMADVQKSINTGADGSAFNNVAKAADGAAESITNVGTASTKSADAATRGMDKTAQATGRARDSMGRFTSAASDAGAKTSKAADSGSSAFSKMRGVIEQAKSGVSGFGSTMNKNAAEMRKGWGQASNGIVGLTTKMAGAIGIANTLGGVFQAGFGRLEAIDNAKFKLEALGNSAKDVETIMTSAETAVKGTAFGLGDAATIAASAVAAGVKPGQELTKYLSLTADAAAVAGSSLSDMGSIINKVQTNQVAYTDDLQQLADRGIPIFQWLQKEYGVTAVELRKMVSDGKVDAATFQKVISENMGGSAKKMGESVSGSIENTKAAIGRLSASILGPVFKAMPGVLANIQSGFDAIGKVAGPALEGVSKVLGPIVNYLKQFSDVLVPLGVALGTFITLMVAAKVATAAWAVAQWALDAAMDANPIFIWIAAIAGIIAAIVLAYNKVGWFRDAVNGLWDIIKSVAGFIAGVFVAAWKWLADAISPVIDFVQKFWRILILGLGPIGLVVNAVIELVKHWDTVASVFSAVWDVVKTVFGAMAGWVTGTLVPIFQAFWDFLVMVFGAIGDALQAVWESVFQPVFEFLSGIITDTLIPAFQSLWDFVTMVFTGIGDAISTVWEGIIMPIFQALYDFITAVLTPVFQVLQVAFQIAWDLIVFQLQVAWGIIQVVFQAIVDFITNVLAPTFQWLYDSVILPVWNLIVAAVQFAVDALQVLWNAIVVAVQWVGSIFQWFYDSVILPVWNAIKVAIQVAYDTVIHPVIAALGAAVQWVGGIFEWLLNNVVRPVWDSIGNIIRSVYDTVIHPVFDLIKSSLDSVGQWFKRTVDFISQVWGKLGDVAKAPVKFIIETVYNNGLRKAFNKVADWLPGVKPLDEVALPQGFKTGGPVRGQGGIDAIPARLTRGEWVLTEEEVKAIGVKNLQRFHNDPVRHNGKPLTEGMTVDTPMWAPGMANGGAVDEVIKRVAGFVQGENGKPYQYGGVGNPSWDCSGLWSGIQHVIQDQDARSGRLFSTESNFESLGWAKGLGKISIGIMRGGGGENSHMAGTVDGTNAESSGGNGVRWGGPARGADNSLFSLQYHWPQTGEDFVSGGAGGGGGGGIMHFLRKKVASAFDAIMNPIGKMIPDFGGGTWGEMPKQVFKWFRDKVRAFIIGKADAADAASASSGGGNNDMSGQRFSGPDMVPIVQNSDGTWTSPNPAWAHLMQRESNGNPTVTQHGYVDANTGGNEASGLFQIAKGTWASNGGLAYAPEAGQATPEQQAKVAARIFKQEGGHPWGAGLPGRESEGDLAKFDSGGVATGTGVLNKNVIAPERILSPYQTTLFEGLLKVLQMIGLEVPTSQVAPVETDFQKTVGDAFTAQGELISNTRAQVERTATSTETSIAAQRKIMESLVEQVGTQLSEQILAPTIKAGTQAAIESASTDAVAKAMGTQVGDIVAAAVNSAISTALAGSGTYDSGGAWPSGTLGINSSGSTETVLTAGQTASLAKGGGSSAAAGGSSSIPPNLLADMLGMQNGPILAFLNVLLSIWLKMIGIQIDTLDTLTGVAKDVRDMRAELAPAFEATGQLVSDTSAYVQRTETGKETEEEERSRIFKQIVADSLKYLVDTLVKAVVDALIKGGVQALTSGVGAAIGSAIEPGVGTAAGAAIGDVLGKGISALVGGLGDMLGDVIVTALDAAIDVVLGQGTFDSGGVALGTGLLVKGTAAPERVLSPSQTEDFDRLLVLLERMSNRRSIYAPFTVTGGETGARRSRDHLLTLLNS